MRYILIVGFLFPFLMYGQLSPVTGGRIQNATTAFGCYVAVGTTVHDIATNRYFFCIAGTNSTSTLTTASSNFKEINTRWLLNGTSYYYNSGNIGIGTSAPAMKLDVAGNVNVSDTTFSYLILPTANGSSTAVNIFAYTNPATRSPSGGYSWLKVSGPGGVSTKINSVSGSDSIQTIESTTSLLKSLRFSRNSVTLRKEYHFDTTAIFPRYGTLDLGTSIYPWDSIFAKDGNSSEWNQAYKWGNHAGLYPKRADSNANKPNGYVTLKYFNEHSGSSQWTTSGSNIYFTTGNVGIGITNPNVKLYVDGGSATAIRGSTTLANGVYGNATSGYGGYFIATTGTGVQGTSSGSLGVYGVSSTGTGGYFSSSSGTGLYANTSSGYSALLLGGNVGIGTTAPTKTIDVAGTMTVSGKTTLNDTSTITKIFGSQTAYLSGGSAGGYNVYNFGGNPTFNARRLNGTYSSPTAIASGNTIYGFNIGGSYTTSTNTNGYNAIKVVSSEAWTSTANGFYFDFTTVPSTTVTPTVRMRIKADGNIGVGTTAPAHKFDVVGSIRSDSVVHTKGLITGVRTITDDHYVLLTDHTIVCNGIDHAITVTLPDPATCIGQEFIISNINNDTYDVGINSSDNSADKVYLVGYDFSPVDICVTTGSPEYLDFGMQYGGAVTSTSGQIGIGTMTLQAIDNYTWMVTAFYMRKRP